MVGDLCGERGYILLQKVNWTVKYYWSVGYAGDLRCIEWIDHSEDGEWRNKRCHKRKGRSAKSIQFLRLKVPIPNYKGRSSWPGWLLKSPSFFKEGDDGPKLHREGSAPYMGAEKN